ncbi:MAG: DUF47 family protein [Verrucomicrobiaceae bacterium]|nr:MAG: DUF47 family protein [Verrucomicrobiaceae bacterium]
MTALQRLFGRDDKFYLLLESSAAEAQAGAGVLVRLVTALNQGPLDEILRDLDLSRRKHKRISQEITEALCSTFATPLEREDIEELSTSLYKISKTIEKIGERLTICPPGLNMEPTSRQVALLEQGTSVLAKMVGELRDKRHGELIRDSYERIQAIEGDADRIMNELLRDLYHGQAEARVVVFWKDIYELLEKGIDRCRDAGSVLFHIVLKNS